MQSVKKNAVYKNLLLITSGSILFTTLGVEWLYGDEEREYEGEGKFLPY